MYIYIYIHFYKYCRIEVSCPLPHPTISSTPLRGADLDASLHAGDTFDGRHKKIRHLKNRILKKVGKIGFTTKQHRKHHRMPEWIFLADCILFCWKIGRSGNKLAQKILKWNSAHWKQTIVAVEEENYSKFRAKRQYWLPWNCRLIHRSREPSLP